MCAMWMEHSTKITQYHMILLSNFASGVLNDANFLLTVQRLGSPYKCVLLLQSALHGARHLDNVGSHACIAHYSGRVATKLSLRKTPIESNPWNNLMMRQKAELAIKGGTNM